MLAGQVDSSKFCYCEKCGTGETAFDECIPSFFGWPRQSASEGWDVVRFVHMTAIGHLPFSECSSLQLDQAICTDKTRDICAAASSSAESSVRHKRC
jgi:hypothetical protein